MEIFGYQIAIAGIIFISSFFGKNIRNIVIVAISIFTLIAVFTTGLAILQFITIFLSYYLTNIYVFQKENISKPTLEKSQPPTKERKSDNEGCAKYGILFIVITAIICTISVYNTKNKISYNKTSEEKIIDGKEKLVSNSRETNSLNYIDTNKSIVTEIYETDISESNIIKSDYEKLLNKSQLSLLKLAKKHFSSYKKNLETPDLYIGLANPYFGDFTNDGIEDILIYYSLEPREGANYIEGQGLMVYENLESAVDFIAQYKAPFLFRFLKIENNIIYIDKVEYTDNDPRCCPSIKTQYELIIDGYQIRETKSDDRYDNYRADD